LLIIAVRQVDAVGMIAIEEGDTDSIIDNITRVLDSELSNYRVHRNIYEGLEVFECEMLPTIAYWEYITWLWRSVDLRGALAIRITGVTIRPSRSLRRDNRKCEPIVLGLRILTRAGSVTRVGNVSPELILPNCPCLRPSSDKEKRD
jgi:hypothetical protein